MKKQLSTAMAAAMAFGTVVPAFTSVVNADDTQNDNKVDLSRAFSFLKADGTAEDAENVAKNGAPVLTRADVYNYNGANANDRDKHTLKSQFKGAKILFQQQNPQDASKDLFVFAKVDDKVLEQSKAEKVLLDAEVDRLVAAGQTVKTFDRDEDFKIVKVNGQYKYQNETLQNVFGLRAKQDELTKFARKLVVNGIDAIGGSNSSITITRNVNAVTTTDGTIKDDLKNEIGKLEEVKTNLIDTINTIKTATLSKLTDDEVKNAKEELQSDDIKLALAQGKFTLSGTDLNVTIPKRKTQVVTIKVGEQTKDDVIVALEQAKKDVEQEIKIKSDMMSASDEDNRKNLDKVLAVLNELLKTNDPIVSDFVNTLLHVDTNKDLKQDSGDNFTFLTLKNGVLVEDAEAIKLATQHNANPNTPANQKISVSDLSILKGISDRMVTFFGLTQQTSLEDVALRSTLSEEISSYKPEIKDGKYVGGRTVKIVLDKNGIIGTNNGRDNIFYYNNEFSEFKETDASKLRNELFADLMNIENGVNVYLGGKMTADGKTEAKANYFTLNFDTMTSRNEKGDDFLPQKRTVTAEEDRQVYHAANLMKYKLEGRKDIIVEVNEYGTKNQNQLAKVYIKKADGTKGDLVLTLDFLNTIEVRKNVAGQPSIVNMPNIEKTDFAKLDWAKNEIVNAMLACYIDATDTFRPKENITRAEFAKILCTVFGIETKDEAIKNLVVPFNDIKTGEWHYRYIAALYNEGKKGTIINGYQDGTFKPKEDITRQEAAKMVAAAYDLKREALNISGENSVENKMDGVVEKIVAVNGQTIHVDTITAFKDDKEIANWADESITALVKENAINGYQDGTFKPNNKITRVEALYMLVKTNKITADDSDIK